MIPVYLSKVLAFVTKPNFVVVPHFSNLDVLSENISDTLKINKSELNFINVNSSLNVTEKVELAENEIFIDESLFSEIHNLNGDSFVYFDNYYQNLLQNLEIAGPASFLTINDSKLLYELGYAYFTRIFKERSLLGSFYFTGLCNIIFTSQQLLSLISDAYSGEGLVKIYASSLMGHHVSEEAKLVGSIFFGSGKAELLVDFGIDEDHKINFSSAERLQVNLGGKPTKISLKTPAKEYNFEADDGEVGFFVDLRRKPIRSMNLLETEISITR